MQVEGIAEWEHSAILSTFIKLPFIIKILFCISLSGRFIQMLRYIIILQVEVFNVLFVKEQDQKFVVHCQDCARKIHPRLEGFVILNQYHLHDLIAIYDNFQLKVSLL